MTYIPRQYAFIIIDINLMSIVYAFIEKFSGYPVSYRSLLSTENTRKSFITHALIS